MLPLRSIYKKARQEISPSTSERKVQNVVEMAKPRKKKCIGSSKSKKLKVRKSGATAEERVQNTTIIDGAEVKMSERRERRKENDCSVSGEKSERRKRRKENECSVSGEKRRRKRSAEEIGEEGERKHSLKLYEVDSDIKKKESVGSKEITKTKKCKNILKGSDLSGERIGTGMTSLPKLQEAHETTVPFKIVSREVQTDFSKYGVNLRESRTEKLDTITGTTQTEIEESQASPKIDDFEADYGKQHEKYIRRGSNRRTMPQRYQKSPRKCEKSCRKIFDSYYTDPEDSPQWRGHESHRSTFSDEQISPRRISSSEHRSPLLRGHERGSRDYYEDVIPRNFERQRSPVKWVPERYRDHSFPDHSQELDNRPELRDRYDRYQIRNYHPVDISQGQFSPNHGLIRCPASGDGARDRFESPYTREYNLAHEHDDRRYFRLGDERRQYVRDMFEPDYRREYPRTETGRDPRDGYNSQQPVYDNSGYYQNYEQRERSYRAETARIPMYDPTTHMACNPRNVPVEPATFRYERIVRPSYILYLSSQSHLP